MFLLQDSRLNKTHIIHRKFFFSKIILIFLEVTVRVYQKALLNALSPLNLDIFFNF